MPMKIDFAIKNHIKNLFKADQKCTKSEVNFDLKLKKSGLIFFVIGIVHI